ncbi:hypothetical protein DLR74_18130 [Vibrio paracholerae]|nr:hypothetical protein DLR74_18130 [Vibrio paracholerae]
MVMRCQPLRRALCVTGKLYMEKVAVFLRKEEAINKFRDVILDSFQESEFTDITICSGFFQERGKYFASDCFKRFTPVFACERTTKVVGVYNGIWKGDFDTFALKMGNITCSCGTKMKIEKRRVKRYHWHAKIYIASDIDGPQLGVIGSSNMTSRAFGNNTQWNFEADVVLWNDANEKAKRIMSQIFESNSDSDASSIIVSTYSTDEPANRGLTLQKRLQLLLEEIESFSEIVE